MYELLSSRDTTGSEDLTKKLTGENAQEVVHKKIILYCLDSPHSCRNWDESPEDLALISYRLDLTLSKLIVENRFLTTEVSMADYFSLCQRLFTISRRYQEHSLLILNENNDLETSRQCAVEDLLANSSLSLCLSFISHLKPVIQGVMSSKVRLLNRIKVPRENLIPMSQYEEFARNSLQIVFPSTQAHQKLFQIFIRSLVVFASLTSEESLHEILTQLLPIQDSDVKLFEVLYYLGNVHELSSNEMSCSRKVSQIVMKWIQSR